MKPIKNIAMLLSLISLLLVFLNCGAFTVSAEEIISDGKYQIDFDSDMPSMGLSAFENKEKKAVVEKISDNYYLTISINSDVVSEFKILGSDMVVGETVKKDGNIERHTFTVTKEQLNSTLKFSTRVTAMDRTVEFTVSPKLDTAQRLGDADTLGERPALFVPKIETDANGSEVEKGTTYLIPGAKATLGTEELTYSVKVFYIDGTEKTEVEVKDNKFVFSKIGEYRLTFRAETDKYKTSEGNNSYTELSITFISKVGASANAKFEDINGILPPETQIQANKITTGETYDLISNLMKGYSENFEIITVDLYDKDGKPVTLTDEILLSLRADDTMNRKDIKVFLLEADDTLTEYERENFGRYIKLNTAKTGTYVLLVEGVEFHMPIWGYVTIAILSIIIVAAIITAVTVITIKRKKARQ